MRRELLLVMLVGLVGCDKGPTAPDTTQNQYGNPEILVGLPQIFSFEIISISPPPGSTIKIQGPQTVHPLISATCFLTSKFVPSWVTIVFIHEDGSDGKVWGMYGDPYDELKLQQIVSGAYVQHITPGDYGSFALGHTVNAMFLVTERYNTYLKPCQDDPELDCLREEMVKYRQFIPLGYKFEDAD